MTNEKPELNFIPQTEVALQWQRQLDKKDLADDFFPSGFGIHDRTFGRLRRGQLAVIMASTSMGKTSFMLSMALHQLSLGVRVFWFCLEVQVVDMFARMVSIKTGIPLLNIIERRLSEEDRRLILGVLPQVSDLPIAWTEDTNLANLVKRLGQLILRGSRSIIYVDHLHLITVPGLTTSERYALVSHAILTLKNVAMSLAVPVVVGCQIRLAAQREDQPPTISDAKNSGDIGDGAQLVLALHRPGFLDRTKPDDELHVFCRKNTHGPTGNYRLVWDATCAAPRERKTNGPWEQNDDRVPF